MGVSKELSNYINTARANNESDESIIAKLKSTGWPEDQIQDAMRPQAASRLEFFTKYRVYILSVLVLLLAGLGAYKGYSYFTNNPEKIWNDTSQKMLDIKSARFSFDASYSEIVPKDAEDDFASFLGETGEMKFSITGKGALLLDQDNLDGDYDMDSTLTAKLGSLSISVGFLSRKIDDYVYYKTDGNPLVGLLGGYNSGEDKPQWVKINLKDNENKELQLLDVQKNQIIDAYKKAKLMRPTKLIGSETINGVSTWHYQADLDKQEVKNYLSQIADILQSSAEEKKFLESVVDKIEFKKLELWIGKSDHLVHQAIIETNSPSIITTSFDSARNKSRDARRFADARQIMTALELFYNDNGRYPKASNGQPQANDGSSNAQFSTYIFNYPEAPTPADGACTDANNKYTYQQLSGGTSYSLTFCVGHDTAGYKAGIIEASPTGMKTKVETHTGVEDELKDIPFSATIQLKLNLSDFNSSVKIEEPKDAFDVGITTRDARRVADIYQLMTAMELFYNDNGRYPKASNSQPLSTDGAAQAKVSDYLPTIPTAPTPADGSCTEANNKYVYEQLGGGASYKITFCLGSNYSGNKAGVRTSGPQGIQ